MKMNPKRKILWSPLVAAAVVALSGCSFSLFSTGAGSTPTRHFVLSSEAPASESLPAVTFSRVTIPSYLDVPQIVLRDGNEISRSEANRWGEPLALDLLAEDIAATLSGAPAQDAAPAAAK